MCFDISGGGMGYYNLLNNLRGGIAIFLQYVTQGGGGQKLGKIVLRN